MMTMIHCWIHSVMNEHDTDNQNQYWSRPTVQQWSVDTDQWSAGQDVAVAVVVRHVAAASARADLTAYVLTSETTQTSTDTETDRHEYNKTRLYITYTNEYYYC